MKVYKAFKKILLLTIVVFMVGACTGDFEEMNTDPTLVGEEFVQTQVLFTRVLKYSIYESYENTRGRIGEFSQYYASQASGNLFTVSNYTSPFDWYRSHVINVNEIIRLTQDDPNRVDQYHMARIIRAWIFHMMTDA